ncbi:hypothetical protein M9Y10_038682 [Tritrichomonas musculus]|uniref:aspartyl aminopeptidase n=1 Tax=Tritrichomonas musculus TaxID=1915356 RepID=A0ABR2K948_9EUKA
MYAFMSINEEDIINLIHFLFLIKVGVKLQRMMNRNGIPSGSTIGPIVSTNLGIMAVDIGQPQLAMHSVRELVAMKDVEDNFKLLTEIYNHYDEYRLK